MSKSKPTTARRRSLAVVPKSNSISEAVAASLRSFELPAAIDVEEVVLGACMLEASAFIIAERLLNKDTFVKPVHQTIYQAMVNLRSKASPIDLITVAAEVKRMGLIKDEKEVQRLLDKDKLTRREQVRLDQLQNAATDYLQLTNLTNRVASSANIEYHAQIIYEAYMRRRAIQIGQELINQSFQPTRDVFELYDQVYRDARVTSPSRLLKIEDMNDAVIRGSKMERKKKIIGNLIKEKEVVFLFGDEGTGKSIAAIQMALAVSKGTNFFLNHDDPEMINEAGPLETLFIDYELEEDEIYDRYNYKGAAVDFGNIKRACINPDFLDFEDADEIMINEVISAIELHKPKFVIIDNITYMTSESQDPTIALKFMKKLIAIQRAHQLTVVVVAHTVKNRDRSLPIESRHMQGASGMKNFAKSMVAISASRQDPDKRYIKHVKCRNGRNVHDSDNVIEVVIGKPDDRLKYEHVGYGREIEHLDVISMDEAMTDTVVQYAHEANQDGTGWRALAKDLKEKFGVGWSHQTVMRKVKAYRTRNGQSLKSAEEIAEFMDVVNEQIPAKKSGEDGSDGTPN